MEDEDYIPQEGDIAEDGQGNFMVFRRGGWHEADAQGVPLAPIPRPDYGQGAVELPNGVVLGPPGPRGGRPEVLFNPNARGQAGAQGGGVSATPEQRGRIAIGLPNALAAEQRITAMEQGLVNDQGQPIQGAIPGAERRNWFNEDWGASWIDRMGGEEGQATRGPIASTIGGSDYQLYEQGVRSIEAAFLPILSGAAVTDTEAQRFIRANLPVFGDGPEVLAEKARNRQRMLNAAAAIMGEDLPYPGLGLFGGMVSAYEEANGLTPGTLEGMSGERTVLEGQPENVPGFSQPTLPTLPGFGGGNGTEPPGSENNPYDYDNLTNDQRQSLPMGAHIARRNRDGTYRLGQFVQAGYTEDVPEGAIQTGEGQFEVRRNRALGEAAAFASGAAEQIPFGDELTAGIVAGLTGEDYGAIRQFDRQQDVIDRAIFGGARNVGGVTGAATGFALPVFSRGGNVLGNLGRTVAEGAGYGALYGAGAADDGNRIEGAVTGGVLGGVGAPVAQGAVRGAAALTEPVLNPLGRVLGNVGRWFRGEQPITAVDQTIGRMAQSAPGPIRGAADEIASYGGTPVFADTLGREGQGLVRAAAARGQTGRDVAADFARGRRADIQGYTAGLGGVLSPSAPRSVAEISEDLARAQSREAQAAFGPVRDLPVNLDANTVEALRGSAGRRALTSAAEALASSPDPAERAVAEQIAALSNNLMDNPGAVQLPVGAVDLISRYLARAGGDPNEQRIFRRLAEAVRENARVQHPDYDRAVTEYAERAQLEDAAEVGAQAIGQRGATRDFVRAAEAATPDQLALIRESARGAFEQQAGTPAGAAGLLDRISLGRDQGQRFGAILDPTEAIDLQRGGQIGRGLIDTAAEVNPGSGSRTFLNEVDDQNLQQAGAAARTVGSVFTGNVGGAVRGAVDFMRGRGFSQADADEITSLALDPARLNEAIAIADRVMGRGRGRRFIRNQVIPRLTGQWVGQLQDDE